MYSATTALALIVLLASIDTDSDAYLYAKSSEFISELSGLCINCYQCTSTNDAKCSVVKDDTNSIDCHSQANGVKTFYTNYLNYLSSFLQPPQTSNDRYCLKLVVGGPASDTVLRTCVEGPADNFNKTCVDLERSTYNNNPSQILGTHKTPLKHCSVCKTDKCNGAAGTSASITLAVGASVLAYLAYH